MDTCDCQSDYDDSIIDGEVSNHTITFCTFPPSAGYGTLLKPSGPLPALPWLTIALSDHSLTTVLTDGCPA